MHVLRVCLFVVACCIAQFAFLFEPAKAASDPPIAFAARVVGDDSRTRLIVDFDRKVDYDVYLLDNPKRVMIDLPETLFSLDSDSEKLPETLVSRLRYGTVAAGRSRVVLELAQPVSVSGNQLREVDSGNRHRLIVDLVRAPQEKFVKSVRVAPKPVSGKGDKPKQKRVFKIVLDPGHGGIDGGATGAGRVREKNITLEFALKLREALEKNPAFDVVMTRETDVFMRLPERLEVASLHNVDLFMSIHADSLRQRGIRGATVYTLSERGSDDLARVLAQKQNRADLIAGLELPKEKPKVADILIDLTRRETEVFSIRFARLLVRSMKKDIRLIRNPHRSADFFVLKAPEVPSVLLELGYLSNREDEKLMASGDWQDKAVRRVKDAIVDFFAPRIAQE